jgi:hypothetical protein
MVMLLWFGLVLFFFSLELSEIGCWMSESGRGEEKREEVSEGSKNSKY